VIEEPDRRIIIRRGDRYVIRHNDLDRLRRRASDFRVRRFGGETYTEVRRPNGVVIITVTDRDGRIIRRIRRLPNGRNFVLFDNRPIYRGGRGPIYFEDYIVDLPPPRIRIPRDEYILEAEEASEEDIYDALTAGPVERLPRGYTLDEVRNSIRLRERMRSVDLNTINFDFGSWEIAQDQYDRLEVIAEVLKRIIRRNPDEVFLLEGHTDAVGSEVDNLTLSDRRAEAVARVLTEEFGVPGENLVTQGYGEQFLKINTQLPERANRRVTIRRIKPLLSQGDDFDESGRRSRDDDGGRYGARDDRYREGDEDFGEDDYGDDRAESDRYGGRGYGGRR
jgi:outer membrane protein OmpA-like peptidoglycan-associated protein